LDWRSEGLRNEHLERRLLGRPEQVGRFVTLLARCQPEHESTLGVGEEIGHELVGARFDKFEIDPERAGGRAARRPDEATAQPARSVSDTSTDAGRTGICTNGAPVDRLPISTEPSVAASWPRSTTVATARLAVQRRVGYSLRRLLNRIESSCARSLGVSQSSAAGSSRSPCANHRMLTALTVLSACG
jgi:hypothetical protein